MTDTPTPERRIRTQRYCVAMAALDTIGPIAERIRNLLAHNRRITMTRRYTYADQPPEVKVGLTMEDIREWKQRWSVGIGVTLKPGIEAFGVGADTDDDTERKVWQRYHADKDDRRNMTEVRITGGMPGDGPARDDLLVIRAWNQHGVCDERVIAFDFGDDRA